MKFNIGAKVKHKHGSLTGVVAVLPRPSFEYYEIKCGNSYFSFDENDLEYDIPSPPVQITATEALKRLNASTNLERFYPVADLPQITICDKICAHEYVKYIGLTERYHYCKKCDKKQ